MPLLTSQTLQSYFDLYSKIEVTLNKDVMKALGFIGDEVNLKIAGMQWPCIIYSTSFESAKVIVSFKPEQIERLRTGSTTGILRYCFQRPDRTELLKFFVNIKVRGFNRYNSARQDLYFVTLDFTQKPPEDLIGIIGTFLEININSKKRVNERIVIKEDIIKKLGIASTSNTIFVDQVPRKCLLRDLSFGGAQILIPGIAKFLQNKSIILRLVSLESGKNIDIPGSVLRVDEVEGRKDIASAAIQYDPLKIPMTYKTLLSEYMRTIPHKGNSNS